MGEEGYAGLARILAEELQSNSLRIVEAGEGATEVRVTLSQNFSGFLWVGQIRMQDKEHVVLQPFTRPAPESVENELLTLQKRRLWEQDAPILDIAVTESAPGNAARLMVLEPGRLALYTREGDGWLATGSLTIPRQNPWPRDPRGRIDLEEGIFTLYLPGQECAGSVSPRLMLDCREVEAPESNWTLRSGDTLLVAQFDAQRNSFTGVIYPASPSERRVGAFFSVAVFGNAEEVSFLFAGNDGMARWFGRATEPQAEFSDWGSEVAALRSSCAEGNLVLATRARDWTQADGVQAFLVQSTTSAPASTVAEFSGPVTALWSASDGSSATAIVRNLRTGRYEAYSLTLACNR